MTQEFAEIPAGVGPHEGIEFDLMRSGKKHIALFYELEPDGLATFLKDDTFECFSFMSPEKQGISVPVWIVFRKTHQAKAISLRKLYEATTIAPWSPDNERKIGGLLGYKAKDIETYIKHVEAMPKKRG